ncbi:MAG: methionine synthase [Prevotellaceae bacterium]|jgi:5-methyltetrahydrofolate--homocysteine methyltransferase|nr:methionine synthase [Prevotellaceae bacterium]
MKSEITNHILVLDGAMGSLIQRHKLGEADFRGELFRDAKRNQKGNNELLNLTQPQLIRDIHAQYLAAGADIVTTNTLNATTVSMAEYGLEAQVYDINKAAATLARSAADEFSARTGKPRFVAGSIGPTSKSLSMSPDVNEPAFRALSFDELAAAYIEQIRGLSDGGADVLLFETIFDTLNLKAGLYAAESFALQGGRRLPIIASLTITDAGGRLLSGQTLPAAVASIAHADLLCVSLNCALGAAQLAPFVEELAQISPCGVCAYPNAGLPNALGSYDQTKEEFAAAVELYMRNGWVNIVGGCCGTTPDHIRLVADAASRYKPRPFGPSQPAKASHALLLSGLETLSIDGETSLPRDASSSFVLIGERTNVSGSKKFARLIRDEKFDEALAVARQQVENGAQIIDLCMDDAMLDAKSAMVKFLNLIAAEPEIARVPVMLDSSKWDVLEAGLKCVQGKSVVNSISLKEGESEFLRRAELIRRYGAAAVVMLFDEDGQADSYERKIAVAERSYRLLTQQLGFAPHNIIFDPNVLAVATGIAEHSCYAVSFIRSCEWIKRNLPHAKISGGVSNLSFAFRGNEPVRGALHSVFLYHAVQAGLDMAIVNAGQLAVYSDMEPQLLQLAEDVVLDRNAESTEKLIEYAQAHSGKPDEHLAATQSASWRNGAVEERLKYAVLKGVADFLSEDISDALKKYSPIDIIEQPLMLAMGEVGELFGSGKMFLPQVVKSARMMKSAVAILQPLIEQAKLANANAGAEIRKTKVLLATVKGDVHDIGKNIVSVVLSCNDIDIVDLGVMVPAEKIIDEAIAQSVDVIGLSGLITPSLDEMEHVARTLSERALSIPLLVGGATTSELHTAVKLDPLYPRRVAHVRDASQAASAVRSFTQPNLCEAAQAQRSERYTKLSQQHESAQQKKQMLTLDEARANRMNIDWSREDLSFDGQLGLVVQRDMKPSELVPLIDWTMFFAAWDMRGVHGEAQGDVFKLRKSHQSSCSCGCDEKEIAAQKLYADAVAMLRTLEDALLLQSVVGYFAAASRNEEVMVYDGAQRLQLLATLQLPRQLQRQPAGTPNLSLADFVAPADGSSTDVLSAYVASVQPRDAQLMQRYRDAGDEYSALLIETLCDRLAEAYSERLTAGGGLRVAVGYPDFPDHRQKTAIFALLNATASIGITLTESCMMLPTASVCGVVIRNGRARYF